MSISNISFLMENYFSDSNSITKKKLDENNIIKIKKKSWNRTEKKLIKQYNFDIRKKTEAFIVEIIKYKRESECDIEFSCRNNKVKVCIHSLSPYISEIELECSKDIDKIKKDISYYYASKE